MPKLSDSRKDVPFLQPGKQIAINAAKLDVAETAVTQKQTCIFSAITLSLI